MSFRFIEKGIDTVNTAGGNVALAEPAGVASGDLLVATLAYRGTAHFTDPAGWTNIAAETSGNATNDTTASISNAHMSYIIRGGGAPALTWTRVGGNLCIGSIKAYRSNGGTFTLVGSSSSTMGANSVSMSQGIPTTTADGQLLVGMFSGARPYNTLSISGGDIDSGFLDLDVDLDKAIFHPFNEWSWSSEHKSSAANGGCLSSWHGIKPDKGASTTVTITTGGDARHSAIFAAFSSGLNDDREYINTSRLQAVAGALDQGIAVRSSKLIAVAGALDEGIAVRNSKLYAIIDSSLEDVSRRLRRRVMDHRVPLFSLFLEVDAAEAALLAQDGTTLLSQSGTDLLIQQEL